MKKKSVGRTVLAVLLLTLLCVGITQVLPFSDLTAQDLFPDSTVELPDEPLPLAPVPPRVRIVNRADDAAYTDLPDEAVPLARMPGAAPAHSSYGVLWALALLAVCLVALFAVSRRRRA